MATQIVDCLILSTGRAASTAIYKYIGAAGRLDLPWNKEPHFWCDITQYSRSYEGLQAINIASLEDYTGLYRDSKLKVDASVGYFFCLEEVIENLQEHGQKPKVIFLYREPVSRAESLFIELKRKSLVEADSINEDIARDRDPGMWWEFYYDNVNYMQSFELMESYFDDILLINYAHFAKNQRSVVRRIMSFLTLDSDRVDEIDLTPVNSSAEAVATIQLQRFRSLGRLLPASWKRHIRTLVENAAPRRSLASESIIRPHLRTSLQEYAMFRKHIQNEDVLCLKK